MFVRTSPNAEAYVSLGQPAGIIELGWPSSEFINIKSFTKHADDCLLSCQL